MTLRLGLVLTISFGLTCKVTFASDTGAMLLGGYGSILTHEVGHAATSHLLGGEVLAFRPYPHKVRFVNEDGSFQDKWVAGLVMSKPFEDEKATAKNAWVAAMGSGGNLLSVFLLAPLLPQLSSDFSKSTLDSMLFFSSFDMAAYTLTDLIFRDKNNDWSRVSELTGVSLYWYWLGGMTAGMLANEFRSTWHQRASESELQNNRWSIGFSNSY